VPLAELADFSEAFKAFTHLRLDGLMTHLASADEEDSTYTEKQIALYNEALALLHEHGFAPNWRHLANTAGMHGHPQARLCYTWGYLGDDDTEQYAAVLELPPVDSPRNAVRAAIGRKRGTG